MSNLTIVKPEDKLYAGIDLHKQYSFVTVMNYQGVIQHQGRYNHREDTLVPQLQQFQNLEATVESTYGWYWFAAQCRRANIPLCLAHPAKVNAIAGRKKTDKEDSQILANLLRTNLLPTAYMPSPEEQSLKELLRFRLQLVEQQTKLKVRLRDILAKQNLLCPYTNILGKKAKQWLVDQQCPYPYGEEITALLTLATGLETQIEKFESQVEGWAKTNVRVQLLMSMPGIGALGGLTLAIEIGEIHRFPNDRALASYAGLVPSVHSSGDKTYYGRTSKHGNKYLRLVLSQAVYHLLRKDGQMKEFYDRIKGKKGAGKAKIAVMNKMMKCIYIMLIKHRTFEIRQVRLGQGSKESLN